MISFPFADILSRRFTPTIIIFEMFQVISGDESFRTDVPDLSGRKNDGSGWGKEFFSDGSNQMALSERIKRLTAKSDID